MPVSALAAGGTRLSSPADGGQGHALSPERQRQQRDDILSRLTSAPLHRLYDYWDARRRDGRLPGRRDIDPLDLVFVLGNLVLVDVLREPLRFRYRLNGTNLEDAFRLRGLTGTWVHEHPDLEFRQRAIGVYSHIVLTGQPLSARRDSVMDNKVRAYDSLMLPLAADGVTVDMVMVGMWFRAG